MPRERDENKFNEYVQWLGMTRPQRQDLGYPLTITDFAKHAGITTNTLFRWREEAKSKDLIPILADNPDVIVAKKEMLQKRADGFDSKLFLRAKQEDICRKLLERLTSGKGNAKDFELFYKLTGNLEPPPKPEEKKEVKKDDVTINIGNLIAIARQQLKDGGDGDFREVEVSDVPAILSGKPLLHSGQGDGINAPVQTVGVPEKPAQDD